MQCRASRSSAAPGASRLHPLSCQDMLSLLLSLLLLVAQLQHGAASQAAGPRWFRSSDSTTSSARMSVLQCSTTERGWQVGERAGTAAVLRAMTGCIPDRRAFYARLWDNSNR